MSDIAHITDTQYFLGIGKSATDKIWREKLASSARNNALAISQKYDVPDLLARVLSARGVDEAQAETFINPTLRNLMPDPMTFTDMHKAATRIAGAVMKGETVAVFGDYDVDGACSAAIMARFLRFFQLDCRVYIPDRLAEGYGPNKAAMRQLILDGAKLVITVDCGANSAEAIAAARIAGGDVIVLDHHQMAGAGTAAEYPLVNPNRVDDLSGQGHLCAAGVVFMTLVAVCQVLRRQAWKNIPDLLGYLDLVALATVCDVVPLVGINRAFVVKGLQVARTMHNPGLAALVKIARIGEPLNAFHLGFILGPRINAGGRIGNSALGAELLSCDDRARAEAVALQLDALNRERQEMETLQLEEAETQIIATLEAETLPAALVVASKDWHPGIVGLIASRLKERLNRPAVAITIRADGTATGSARSVAGVDIGRLVSMAVAEGLLTKGGGHSMAAGLTISPQKIALFQQWLPEQIKQNCDRLDSRETLLIDGALSAGGMTEQLFHILEKAGPYGAGHEAPLLALPAHKLLDVREVGRGHISVTLSDVNGKRLKAVAFRAAGTPLGDFLVNNRMNSIHLVGNLSINYWNGTATPQLRIIDAAAVNR